MSSDNNSAIPAPPTIQAVMCFAFFTRLPINWPKGFDFKCLAGAMWALPLVGYVVGAAGWLVGICVYFLIGPSALLPGMAALGTMLLLTGAMHFDGLADMADGLGGESDRERKLAIMKDSHIGTYGVLALVFAALPHISLLTGILSQFPSLWQLIANAQAFEDQLYPALLQSAGLVLGAAAFSRAMVTCVMILTLPAKMDGMAADAGQTGGAGTALAALVIASVPLLLFLPISILTVAMVTSAIAAFVVMRIAKRHIGGYTGDVLGAVQVVSEIAYLVGGALIAQNLMLMVNWLRVL